MARNDPVHVINKFLGINNTQPPEALEDGEMVALENVDVTDAAQLRLRPGVTQIDDTAARSLGGCDAAAYFERDGNLYQLDAGGQHNLIRSGVTGSAPLSYAEVNGLVYYSNGVQKGCVEVDSGSEAGWGQAPPSEAPELSFTPNGNLPAGLYQVAVTAISASGEESPPVICREIYLETVGGIVMTAVEAPPGATWLRIYMTQTNGATLLFAAGVKPPMAPTVLFNSNLGLPLTTYGCVETPPGESIAYFNGRMLVGAGATLWFTLPYQFGVVNPVKGFVQFPEVTRSIMPTKTGVFVCTSSRVVWLEGQDPNSWGWEDRGNSAIIPGTEAQVPRELFGEDVVGITEDVWVWMSDKGFMAGMPNGEVLDLLKGKVDVDAGVAGAGVFERREGASMYRATVKNPGGDAANFAFTDRVVAEVYRNGVLVS